MKGTAYKEKSRSEEEMGLGERYTTRIGTTSACR
jgi:hypothetical protein